MSDGPNSFSGLVRSIATSAQAAIQADWVAVLLRSDDAEWFVTSADTRQDAPFIKVRHNSQVAKWLESQDAVLRVSDPYLQEPAVQFDEWDDALFDEHRIQLAAPINDGTGLIGIMVAGAGVAGSTYPVSALNYMKSLSAVAGLAIAGNAQFMFDDEEDDDAAEDQLLRRMAHDLKGPLATVMTYLDLVRQNKPGNLTDDQMTRLDKANRSGRRLLRLLNDFVDYARMQAGTVGLDRTEFELGDLASDITRELEQTLEARKQTLRCTVPPNKAIIWADRMRLTQIVSVLVGNASRYSADALPIDLEMWAEGNRLRVRVVDQGRGMTESQLAKVFEPFDPDQPSRRSENDQTEAGSGLGLVLARGLVRLHGGELTIQSSEGKGTVVEVSMPVVLAGEGSQTEAA